MVFLGLLIGVDPWSGGIGLVQRLFVAMIMAWLILASPGLRSAAIIPRQDQAR